MIIKITTSVSQLHQTKSLQEEEEKSLHLFTVTKTNIHLYMYPYSYFHLIYISHLHAHILTRLYTLNVYLHDDTMYGSWHTFWHAFNPLTSPATHPQTYTFLRRFTREGHKIESQDCMHCILMLHNQYCFVQYPWHAQSFMYLWGIKYITQKASSVRDTASFSIKQSREDWWGRDKDNTEKGSEEWFWYIVVVIQSPGGSKHTYVSIHPIDSKFGLKVDELILSPATNRPI